MLIKNDSKLYKTSFLTVPIQQKLRKNYIFWENNSNFAAYKLKEWKKTLPHWTGGLSE